MVELKDAAKYISEVCQRVIESDNETIKENIEKFCLFIEILTKQFLPPVVVRK